MQRSFHMLLEKDVPNFPPIKIQDQPVERVGVYNSLGVLLNNELKWNEHVHYITTKASKRLYMLRMQCAL